MFLFSYSILENNLFLIKDHFNSLSLFSETTCASYIRASDYCLVISVRY